MAVYVSQETEEPTPIVCRFCETGQGKQFEDKPTRVAAVRLRGQWEGGDLDVDPHWVPVCVLHDDAWDKGDDEQHPDLEPKYQLPAFDLPTWWVVIDRDDRPDLAIGPYASQEGAQWAAGFEPNPDPEGALLILSELQESGTDCTVLAAESYERDIRARFEDVVLIDLDLPEYTG